MKGAIATGLGCEESAIVVENFDKDSGSADVFVTADPAPSKDLIAKAFADAGGRFSVD